MNRLILVRHGRTAANVVKALDSRPPGQPLDELGEAQAAALGRALADAPVTAVYASRAIRAQQTAAPIAAAHSLPVVVIDGVQEVDCGDLEGNADHASREQFEVIYQAWMRGELDARLPGGESAREVAARFVRVVESVVAESFGLAGAQAAVVVSHGAAIRMAVGALLGESAETRYVPNSGRVILRATATGWALEHWDDATPVLGDVTGGGAERGS